MIDNHPPSTYMHLHLNLKKLQMEEVCVFNCYHQTQLVNNFVFIGTKGYSGT